MVRSKGSPAARDEARRDALRGLRLGGGQDARPRADVGAPAQPAPSTLRLLGPAAAAPSRAPALPTLATAGDVREAVRYLRKKPAGVSPAEAAEDIRRRVFEPRKVAAYEAWGLVERRGERISLTASGRELAARLAPGAEGYRALLARTEPYHAALEWVARECGELVTHQEVAAFWRQLCGDAAPSGGEEDDDEEARAVCFFQVCQAAALGTLTVGKRGQPSRLRVERDELAEYLARARRLEAEGSAAGDGAEHAARPGRAAARAGSAGAGESAGGRLRVFVSAGAGARLAEQVQTVLGVADNECHLLARGASDSLLVSAETARAMRRCDAAVIIVTREDCAGGGELRRGLAAEISAADVVYGRRVALLWERGLPVPEALAELLRFEFESDGLTWDIGIGLLKAVKDFQTRALDAA